MVFTDGKIAAGPLMHDSADAERVRRQTVSHRRLSQVFDAAPVIPYDDNARIVFFSDCHRGDSSRADAFAWNEPLFVQALTHYYQRGYTYIEVGDGDEMWQNRSFDDIRRAHEPTFDMLHAFERHDRLHVILGNHDIPGDRRDPVEKDGIPTHEGLVLRHIHSGQELFVVHGHQADFMSDQLYHLGRFLVRRVWRRLLLLGLGDVRWVDPRYIPSQAHLIYRIVRWIQEQTRRIERRIEAWVQNQHQVVICGHTHRPRCAVPGAHPYFNTGSCTIPGVITGLEIHAGTITPVEWTASLGLRPGQAGPVTRRLLSIPHPLRLYS